MTLSEIQKLWKKNLCENTEAVQKFWDFRAEEFEKHPIPQRQDDPFLQIIEKKTGTLSGLRILDIGCGAGGYAIACAGVADHVVGVDISSGMIDSAKKRTMQTDIHNLEFMCLDWSAADIDMLGFRSAFDIVFAHMTPAVCGCDELERMICCSRRWCFLEKHIRRTDAVRDYVFSSAKITQNTDSDDSLIGILAYLYKKGLSPQLYYRPSVIKNLCTVQQMTERCLRQAYLHADITESQRDIISDEVRSVAEQQKDIVENGFIEETISSTIVTVCWTVGELKQ